MMHLQSAHTAQDRLEKDTEYIVLDFSRSPYLDTSGSRAIASIATHAKDAKVTILAVGLAEEASKTLSMVVSLDERFETRTAALSEAVRRINSEQSSTGGAAQPNPQEAEELAR